MVWNDKQRYFQKRRYSYFGRLERVLKKCGVSYGGKYDLEGHYSERLGACPRVNCHSEYRHDPPIRVMNTNPIELKRAFKATIIRCSSWSAISRTGC